MSRLAQLARNPWARGVFVLAMLVAALARDLVARAGLDDRLPRLRRRLLALGDRRGPAQPALRAGALALLAADDRPGAARAASRASARSSRPSGSGCSGTPCSRPGPASSPASPSCGGTCRTGKGTSATLLGTVFAHRLFDLFPVAILVTWVLLTAKIPHWAVTSLVIFGLVGFVLLTIGLALRPHRRGAHARRHGEPPGARDHGAGRGSRSCAGRCRRSGRPLFQCVGWLMQLFAVWAVMEAFNLDLPLPAAGLVLVLMNVATIFPLWPGNIGLLQAAVALPLVQYGVPYSTGFAYGLVLQAVEMSVGVGVGLIFLAREGLSLASLKTMEEEQAADETALVARERSDGRERRRVASRAG